MTCGRCLFEKEYQMSAMKQIKASARAGVGKGAARAVRREGNVPAVIYGGKEPVQPITLAAKETSRLIFAGHFLTTIFEIDVDGKKVRAIPRDYQLDPVRDFPLHVDFLRLAEGATIKVQVPVHVTDQETSPGLKRGGALQIVEHSVELIVDADHIPDSIDVSVASLDMGESIHINDLKLPNGAKPTSRENLTLVTIGVPIGFTEAAEDAAAAAAATPAAAAPAKKA
jgi:large subunit ribosomal protein L25